MLLREKEYISGKYIPFETPDGVKGHASDDFDSGIIKSREKEKSLESEVDEPTVLEKKLESEDNKPKEQQKSLEPKVTIVKDKPNTRKRRLILHKDEVKSKDKTIRDQKKKKRDFKGKKMSKGNILGHGSGADEEETENETEYANSAHTSLQGKSTSAVYKEVISEKVNNSILIESSDDIASFQFDDLPLKNFR